MGAATSVLPLPYPSLPVLATSQAGRGAIDGVVGRVLLLSDTLWLEADSRQAQKARAFAVLVPDTCRLLLSWAGGQTLRVSDWSAL